MKYIGLEEFGGPELLTVCEGEPPEIADDEVLIKVAAAGVNRPDVIQRQGLYPAPPGASPVLGLEVAGEVVGVGSSVDSWQVGDRVCALSNGGGYAEFAAVPASQCLVIPAGFSMPEAAALPETMFTVWSNVMDRAKLQAGESFLVHGGSSGIGTTAIQMVKALGGRVFATAGSDQKCQACESLGAEIAINYQQQDFVERLKMATDNRGIDVILDIVGGDYIARNIKLAAMEGRIVNIAFLQGSVANINFMPVMLKRLTLTGSTLRPQSTEAKAAIARQLKDNIWPLCENGKIRPVIASTFPLEAVADAHRLMETNQHIGKIVLLVE
jgi:NADPH:quinone reductase